MSHCNRELVQFYLGYKMSSRDYPVSLLKPTDDGGQTAEDRSATCNGTLVNSEDGQLKKSCPCCASMDAIKSTLKDSANEFERRFSQGFSDLSLQFHITPDTAYQNFKSVLDELFKDGINWGRVVGLFVFGGVLCVECVERNMSELVSRIAEWMTMYLDEQISPWIHSQGGWDCFAQLYGQDGAAEARRFQETLKKWTLVAVALLTGLLLGLLIAKKR
ncbi:bcl-2-like protein 1 [Oryzias melastigma]|uniref:Bcl-2-like protein 1 n=1 Tax=Oryzias melastigma TaxID=30732 RepID=A0A3B3E2W4_ORYME|nr:bcl-2-like protein 1 [Oryzias melastigma]XP_024125600.1 bcl-2-like protein 1 [Oryzias melastigma]XP_036067663.1 bcl-2-like protein 1 [Oryzias melastigma]